MPESDESLSLLRSSISTLESRLAGLQEQLDAKGTEQRQVENVDAKVQEIAGRMIAAAFAKLKIQATTPLRASGSGYNITITSEPVLPRKASGYATCDPDNPGQLLIFIDY